MKIRSVVLLIFVGIILLILPFTCTRIDAGHVGIKVNLYGTEKGVSSVTEVTGRVWFNPITTEVYEFPTFVQQVDLEPFVVNSKDASEFVIDPYMTYFVKAEKVTDIFVKYRKPLTTLERTVLRTAVYDSYRLAANKYTADSLMSNRSSFEESVQMLLSTFLEKENFVLQQLTSGITPPKSLKNAIDAKNQAVQDALKYENQVKQEQAKAKMLVAKKEGQASALIAQAEGEYKAALFQSKANREISQSITPTLIEWRKLEVLDKKWDGKQPTTLVGSSTGTLLQIK
jgi:regulator of protease activity HflC (stomatin/prohibitin superfamily)